MNKVSSRLLLLSFPLSHGFITVSFLPPFSSFVTACIWMTITLHFLAKSPVGITRLLTARSLLGTHEVLVSFFCPPCTYCRCLADLELTIARTPTDNCSLGKCFLEELNMDEGMNPFIKDFPSSAWKPNILFFLSYNLINTCLNILCLNLFFFKKV